MSTYVPPISIYPGDACSLEATYACGYDLIRNLNTIVACFNGVVVTIDACPGIGDPFPDYSCVYYAQTNSPFMMPYCVGGSKPTGPPQGYKIPAFTSVTTPVPTPALNPISTPASAPVFTPGLVSSSAFVATTTKAPVVIPTTKPYTPPISIYPGDSCTLNGVYACSYDFDLNLNMMVACYNNIVVKIDVCSNAYGWPDFNCVYYAQADSQYMMPYCVGGTKPTGPPAGIVPKPKPSPSPSPTPSVSTIPVPLTSSISTKSFAPTPTPTPTPSQTSSSIFTASTIKTSTLPPPTLIKPDLPSGTGLSITSPANGSNRLHPRIPSDAFLNATTAFEIADCSNPQNVQSLANGALSTTAKFADLTATVTVPALAKGSSYCIKAAYKDKTQWVYWYSPTFSVIPVQTLVVPSTMTAVATAKVTTNIATSNG
ncbi:hypothetical protein HDU79_007273, partial [Rhizoclosmatium sp. JEL0117]